MSVEERSSAAASTSSKAWLEPAQIGASTIRAKRWPRGGRRYRASRPSVRRPGPVQRAPPGCGPRSSPRGGPSRPRASSRRGSRAPRRPRARRRCGRRRPIRRTRKRASRPGTRRRGARRRVRGAPGPRGPRARCRWRRSRRRAAARATSGKLRPRSRRARRAGRSMRSQASVMRRGSRPISAGPSSRSTVVTSDAQSPAEPTAALASPKPSAPSLVRTVTRTASKVRRRPKSEVCWPASGIGARSQRASTAAISIGGLWSRAAATRREVRDARPCRPRASRVSGTRSSGGSLGPGVPDRRAERAASAAAISDPAGRRRMAPCTCRPTTGCARSPSRSR